MQKGMFLHTPRQKRTYVPTIAQEVHQRNHPCHYGMTAEAYKILLTRITQGVEGDERPEVGMRHGKAPVMHQGQSW
jgi:hypothetical protein